MGICIFFNKLPQLDSSVQESSRVTVVEERRIISELEDLWCRSDL